MTDVDRAIDGFLSGLAIQVHDAMKAVDAFISESISNSPIKAKESASNPLLVEGAKEAMTARRAFLEKTPEGKAFLKDFDDSSNRHQKQVGASIQSTMDRHFSVSANHAGKAASEWCRPGAASKLSPLLRGTSDDTLNKEQVSDTKELQQFKFNRELCLCER